jgi:hypothetical protein
VEVINLDYCILPISTNSYKGLEQDDPVRIEKDPKILELWNWFVNERGDEVFIHNKDKAFDLIHEYKKYGINYDLVSVSNNPIIGIKDEFLGIDVASKGGYSMLYSGLLFWVKELNSEKRTGIIETIIRYFRPRLNLNLLFGDGEDACLFAKVVNEIASLNPEYGFVEHGYNYYPQYLYLVKE